MSDHDGDQNAADGAIAAEIAADTHAHADVFAAARKFHSQKKTRTTRAATTKNAERSNVNAVGPDRSTPLLRPNVNAVGPGGSTPLLLAARLQNFDDVEALLGFDADPTVEGQVLGISPPPRGGLPERDRYYETPLSVAAWKGDAAITGLLLAHRGVCVNQASSDIGTTALFTACNYNQHEVARMLLVQGGIEVNKATTDDGKCYGKPRSFPSDLETRAHSAGQLSSV